MRQSVVAVMLLLGACVHAPPRAPAPVADRSARVEYEVARPPAEEVASAEKAAEPVEEKDAPKGVDLSRFELPVQYNERVQEYIDLYSQRRRSTFAMWLRRMGRYRGVIEDRLAQHGLPRELVYLPLIESAYETNAASHAKAVGLWQFMAGTARSEGLEVSDYVDERRDPIRSTEAALRHLSGLYNHFGSWYLTAAAYNTGSTRIARLLKQRGYSKGDDNVFWALHDELPRETRDYVPMLLAATIVGENTEHFGIRVTTDEPIRFDVVVVGGATELRAVAKATGASLEEVKSLNPHYIKAMTPPDRRSEVRIPVGSAEGFAEKLARIPPGERIRQLTSTHIVKSGETLSAIARKYGTTVKAITTANRITRPNAIAAGRKLVIPSTT